MEAVIGIQRYIADHPEASEGEAIDALRRSDADYAGSDYDAGLELRHLFSGSVQFDNPRDGIRDALTVLIRLHRPWWYKLAPYGRQRLAAVLTTDELQTFRAAGLMDAPASDAIATWWANLASEARQLADDERSAQGRYAEKLSLKYEEDRLKSLGIEQHPKWIAIEDNSAGYDILSFELKEHGLINKLIEVKSTTSSSARLILTRGEWDAALKFGAAYHFHLWKLPAEELIIKSVDEIALHVPTDAGQGAWQTVQIVL
jgi:hypothetical protein